MIYASFETKLITICYFLGLFVPQYSSYMYLIDRWEDTLLNFRMIELWSAANVVE